MEAKMPTVYIFRGKSATGKTTMSNILSHHLNIAVFRKDDVFDPLSKFIGNHKLNSQASYDVLSSMINTSINNGNDVIVDIALPHKPNYELFLSKIDLKNHRIISFLCDCSSESIWLSRWSERLKAPLPNQFFRNLCEIKAHYANMDITPLSGEYFIDSSRDIEALMHDILLHIKEASL
jgi:predicted kinase